VYSGSVIQGARAAGLGVAFTATADDPSAVAFNPAGLTQLSGTHYYGGSGIFFMGTEYTSPTGFTEETKSEVYFPPHAYLTSDFGLKDFGFGLGIYSPLGIGGRKWSDTGPIRYFTTENSIVTIDISATAGWAVIPDRLSIGGSILYMYSRNVMERMVDQSAFGAQDAKVSYDGSGGGIGFTLSLLANPLESFRIGVHYRSRVEITHEGDFELEHIASPLHPFFGGDHFETEAKNDQDMPQILGIGVAYAPTKSLTIEMDFQWLEWSVFERPLLDLEDEVPEAGLVDSVSVMDWKNSWVISLGTEYHLNDQWALRAGYFFTENQIPADAVHPATPEAQNHSLNIGVGYKTGKLTLDAAYTYQIPADREVDNEILSGEYTNSTQVLMLSAGYAF